MEWMLLPLRRYAEFSGRSRRLEYWMFALFQLLIYLALAVAALIVVSAMGGFEEGAAADDSAGAIIILFFVAAALVWLGLLIPNLAVIARRMQDQNIAGAVGIVLYLIGLVIGITGFILFILSLIPGTRGPNQYGLDPKNPDDQHHDIFS